MLDGRILERKVPAVEPSDIDPGPPHVAPVPNIVGHSVVVAPCVDGNFGTQRQPLDGCQTQQRTEVAHGIHPVFPVGVDVDEVFQPQQIAQLVAVPGLQPVFHADPEETHSLDPVDLVEVIDVAAAQVGGTDEGVIDIGTHHMTQSVEQQNPVSEIGPGPVNLGRKFRAQFRRQAEPGSALAVVIPEIIAPHVGGRSRTEHLDQILLAHALLGSLRIGGQLDAGPGHEGEVGGTQGQVEKMGGVQPEGLIILELRSRPDPDLLIEVDPPHPVVPCGEVALIVEGGVENLLPLG